MSATRKRAPKYQNKVAFAHNRKSKKTAIILSLPNQGLCKRCYEKIEWRKKYRKYKPLKAPSKCQKCEQRTVKRAYHNLCDDCAKSLDVCGMCREPNEIVEEVITDDEIRQKRVDEQQKIEYMKERERRTYFRKKYQRKKEEGEEDGEEGSEGSEGSEGEYSGSEECEHSKHEDEETPQDLELQGE